MHNISSYLVGLTLAWSALQSAAAQCSKEVLKGIERYALEQYLGDNEVFAYDLTLKITPLQSTQNVKTQSHMQVMIGHNLYVNTSELVTLYADSAQLFSVLKPSKSMVRQDLKKGTLSGYTPKELLKYVDSTTCSNLTVGAMSYTKVTCTLQKEFAASQMIDQVEYWIDPLTQKLYKAKVYYSKKSGLRHIEMIYNSIQQIPCPEHLRGPLKDLFFDPGTKVLKAKYKRYRFTDQRKVRK